MHCVWGGELRGPAYVEAYTDNTTYTVNYKRFKRQGQRNSGVEAAGSVNVLRNNTFVLPLGWQSGEGRKQYVNGPFRLLPQVSDIVENQEAEGSAVHGQIT